MLQKHNKSQQGNHFLALDCESYALSACARVCVWVWVIIQRQLERLGRLLGSPFYCFHSVYMGVCVCTCDTQSQLLLLLLLLLWRIRNIPLAHTLRGQYKYIFMCFLHPTPSSFVIYNIFGYAVEQQELPKGGCYNFSCSLRAWKEGVEGGRGCRIYGALVVLALRVT